MEVWKDIPGFEGLYAASSLGRIKSYAKFISNNGGLDFRKERLLQVSGKWYTQVILTKNGVKHPMKVHRIIAETFLPKEDGKKCVNHKNGNKQDNQVVNLEWVTHSENTTHAHKTGLIKRIKK